MGSNALSVRMPPDVASWVSIRAEDAGRSLNSEILEILKAKMGADPARIVIRTCVTREGTFHCAALNDSARDFFTGEFGGTIEEAYEAALTKIAKHGFNLRQIEFDYRTENFIPAPQEFKETPRERSPLTL
jgi:plasmid stability protein